MELITFFEPALKVLTILFVLPITGVVWLLLYVAIIDLFGKK